MQDKGKIDADCIFFGTLAGLGVSNSDGGGTVNLDASGKADSAVAKKAASRTKAVSCLQKSQGIQEWSHLPRG